MKRNLAFLLFLVFCLLATACPGAPQKVVLDTDIGDDVDDAYALTLLTSLRSAQILGVTTAFGETGKRAELAAKLLSVVGRRDIPVCAGRASDRPIGPQYAWARGFRSKALRRESAVEFLRGVVEKYPGEVTLIAVGPLTNLGDLLTRYPAIKPKIRGIVLMGGSVHVGYNNQSPPNPEWNIKCDPAAARIVYNSGVPVTMAGLEVTTMLKLDVPMQKRLCAKGSPMTDALSALTLLWGNNIPTLYDPMAVAYALGHTFCEAEKRHVEVMDDGMTRLTEGPPNVTVLVRPRKEAFMEWYVTTLLRS